MRYPRFESLVSEWVKLNLRLNFEYEYNVHFTVKILRSDPSLMRIKSFCNGSLVFLWTNLNLESCLTFPSSNKSL